MFMATCTSGHSHTIRVDTFFYPIRSASSLFSFYFFACFTSHAIRSTRMTKRNTPPSIIPVPMPIIPSIISSTIF